MRRWSERLLRRDDVGRSRAGLNDGRSSLGRIPASVESTEELVGDLRLTDAPAADDEPAVTDEASIIDAVEHIQAEAVLGSLPKQTLNDLFDSCDGGAVVAGTRSTLRDHLCVERGVVDREGPHDEPVSRQRRWHRSERRQLVVVHREIDTKRVPSPRVDRPVQAAAPDRQLCVLDVEFDQVAKARSPSHGVTPSGHALSLHRQRPRRGV